MQKHNNCLQGTKKLKRVEENGIDTTINKSLLRFVSISSA